MWVKYAEVALQGRTSGVVAVSASLRLLAVSNLPGGSVDMYLFNEANGQFAFSHALPRRATLLLGPMAFLDDAPAALLVHDTDTDSSHVRVVDVWSGAQGEYVASTFGTLLGLACKRDMVALALRTAEEHSFVHLYRQCGTSPRAWMPDRRVNYVGLGRYGGIRFSSDGTSLAIASGSGFDVRAVEDLSLVHQYLSICPISYDVDEFEGQWLVAGDKGVMRMDRTLIVDAPGNGMYHLDPKAIAVVPGWGLVMAPVDTSAMFLFANPDTLAMNAMSAAKVQWMAAVARAIADVFSPAVLHSQLHGHLHMRP